MDWKIAAATFGLMFFAELGDKTQLLVLNRSASTRSPVSVFVGAAAALVVVTAIGVLAGGLVSKLPERYVRVVAGLLFIGFGLWTLFGPKA
jgi:putative Ca2+/H+ antiporter (TMEM165/GDT1 family)